MTALVHIGDFHASPGPRNVDRYAALDQIIAEALTIPKAEFGGWIWPGDIFDSRSHVDDRNAIATRLIAMGNAGPVVICYGNHDQSGDLELFAHLRTKHRIYVVSRPELVCLELADGVQAAIFVLPYPHRAGLVQAGVAKPDLVETAGDVLEPIFMEAAAGLSHARAAGRLTLMCGHVNVAGSIVSTGQPLIGQEIELHPKHLDRLGFIPKLLNHVHKPQEIAGAIYAGSVCRLSYGEIEEKRYVRVMMVPGEEAWAWASHPIAIPPMVHVEGRLTPAGFEFTDPRCAPNEFNFDWTGADVRVRFSYKASQKSVLNEDLVRAPFVGALRLKVEGVAEPDRELRAPEVAAATTLAEKLAAYRKEPLPHSVKTKLYLLVHSDGDGLLASIEQHIAALEEGRDLVMEAFTA